jgi:hypothetical protein
LERRYLVERREISCGKEGDVLRVLEIETQTVKHITNTAVSLYVS